MQKRYVTIWFRHLKTDWFTRRQPSLKTTPFALAHPDHGRMIITAVNPSALAKDIFPGMVVADARAIHHGIHIIDEQPALADKLLKNLSRWCMRYTPIVAIDPPDGLILDATGCAHLWKGETAYINDITTRLKNFGYNVQAAISDTIGCSWALSRFSKGNTIIKTGDHMNELLAMPPEALRLEEQTAERLHKLGLKYVKDFIGMPRQSLRRRFGDDFLKKLDRALGYEEEFIQPVEEVEPFQERLLSFEPIITLAGIETALTQLLDNIYKKLSHEQKGLRAASLKCFMTDGKIQCIEISTTHPTNNRQHIFKLFELKFNTINPEAGIEVFLLEVKKVAEITPVQEKLWDVFSPGWHGKEPGKEKECNSALFPRSLSELLDRLTAKFGEGHIKRFVPDQHYWPERSFKPATNINESASVEWKTTRPRPLQLLDNPEPIEVTAPIPDYPPMNFRHKGTLHKIVNADGPERIEQEWWLSDGEHRDYYYVEDEEGRRYWLFRLGHYDADKNYGWFLHGYFA
jgi:protein ImuB